MHQNNLLIIHTFELLYGLIILRKGLQDHANAFLRLLNLQVMPFFCTKIERVFNAQKSQSLFRTSNSKSKKDTS